MFVYARKCLSRYPVVLGVPVRPRELNKRFAARNSKEKKKRITPQPHYCRPASVGRRPRKTYVVVNISVFVLTVVCFVFIFLFLTPPHPPPDPSAVFVYLILFTIILINQRRRQEEKN